MSRAGELREKDIARRVRRAKGESLTARNDAVTTEKERANEGDENPKKDANDDGLNSPPPTPALGDEQRGATEGLNVLSPVAPTREGGAVASDDVRGDENGVASDLHSPEPGAQRDVEVTETGANEESDGTCTDTNVEIHSDGDERPEDREELAERVDGGEDARGGDGGGCHTGPDSSGVPSGQYMEASPDARGVAGLEKFAQVDIPFSGRVRAQSDECDVRDENNHHLPPRALCLPLSVGCTVAHTRRTAGTHASRTAAGKPETLKTLAKIEFQNLSIFDAFLMEPERFFTPKP
jgi:hypothetical protein